jgi:hypothetical protein
MELVEALIHVANLSAFTVFSVLTIMLLVILGNTVMGRNIILRSLEARLPRGFSLTLRIIGSILLVVGISLYAWIAYKGLTGSFGYEIYEFGGVQPLLLMTLFGAILSLFFIAGFTILALKRVRSSTFKS